MDLTPRLLAAADMCEAGEEVNLDELSFLLRYAADEIGARPQAVVERDRLLDSLRRRVLARCDLLDRPESDCTIARSGSIDALAALEERLDHELQQRFPAGNPLRRSDSSRPAGTQQPGLNEGSDLDQDTGPVPGTLGDRFRSGAV